MKELINKTEKELKAVLAEKKEALRAFRFAMSGGKIKNLKEGTKLKKEIAQIMTVLNKPAYK
jgi:ribosomal protein L29